MQEIDVREVKQFAEGNDSEDRNGEAAADAYEGEPHLEGAVDQNPVRGVLAQGAAIER